VASTINLRARSAAPRRHRSLGGYAFVSGYVALLLALGVLPTIYGLSLAFQKNSPTGGNGGFAGFSNFISTAEDYRFLPAFENIGEYLGVWLVGTVVLVLVLALLVHSVGRRLSSTMRFVYYLPGALVGSASVVLWLFVLDPVVSPVAPILRGLGYSEFVQVVSPSHLPVVFALMAFWTGAGGWILVMYGALNNIPNELIESARLDGASAWQMATRIKLPLIKKWVAYMLILSIAGGTQLFVEPTLVGSASQGLINPSWSPQQLAYNFAFQQSNFNAAAAISIDLLVLALACAAVIVTRSGLFERS
jgi:multiple sugar transport system permease protein